MKIAHTFSVLLIFLVITIHSQTVDNLSTVNNIIDSLENLKYLRAERDSLEMVELRKKHKDILIDRILLTGPNSASGFNVYISLYNLSKKTIKYITLYVSPFNGVGDKISCTIRRRSQTKLEITGPLKTASIDDIKECDRSSQHIHWFFWETLWYNPSITCIELDKVIVQFMDNSTYTYVREIPKILSEEIKNDCRYGK